MPTTDHRSLLARMTPAASNVRAANCVARVGLSNKIPHAITKVSITMSVPDEKRNNMKSMLLYRHGQLVGPANQEKRTLTLTESAEAEIYKNAAAAMDRRDLPSLPENLDAESIRKWTAEVTHTPKASSKMNADELRSFQDLVNERMEDILRSTTKETRSQHDSERYDALRMVKTAVGSRAMRNMSADVPDIENASNDQLTAWSKLNFIPGRVSKPDEPGSYFGGGQRSDRRDDDEMKTLLPSESFRSVVESDLQRSSYGRSVPSMKIGRAITSLITGKWQSDDERRAMSGADDVSGGFLLNPVLSADLIDLARAKTQVLKAGAKTIPMTTSELLLARIGSDPTVAWKGEGSAITPSTLGLEQIRLRARTLAGMVTLSLELIEDSPNSSSLVEGALAQALALELDRVALRGNGANEPLGLVNRDGVQSLLGASGNLTYDDLSKAIQMIRLQNVEPTGAIFSPRVTGYLDRLKDGEGSYQSGPPSWIALPKFDSTQLPSNLGGTTDETEIFIGKWDDLLLGLRTGVTIEISRHENEVFSKMQISIRAYLRADFHCAREPHFVKMTGFRVP